MSDELTKKQKEELQKLTKQVLDEARLVVKSYENEPSEISGSVVQIHETSPFLQKWLNGDKWKKVLSYIPFKSNKK